MYFMIICRLIDAVIFQFPIENDELTEIAVGFDY